MTKKHFKALAKVLRTMYFDSPAGSGERRMLLELADVLSNVFCQTNPMVDRQKFNDAIFEEVRG